MSYRCPGCDLYFRLEIKDMRVSKAWLITDNQMSLCKQPVDFCGHILTLSKCWYRHMTVIYSLPMIFFFDVSNCEHIIEMHKNQLDNGFLHGYVCEMNENIAAYLLMRTSSIKWSLYPRINSKGHCGWLRSPSVFMGVGICGFYWYSQDVGWNRLFCVSHQRHYSESYLWHKVHLVSMLILVSAQWHLFIKTTLQKWKMDHWRLRSIYLTCTTNQEKVCWKCCPMKRK